jgi:hypothetical protein
MLSLIAAEIIVQPSNHSVAFFKAKDVTLTSDIWRVVIILDMGPYEEVISKIQEDLLVVLRQRNEFTSTSELRQTDTLLKTLEFRLKNFKQILPKVDPRQGLINKGGIVLRTLFGTATITDLQDIHETIDVLQQSVRCYTLYFETSNLYETVISNN